MTEPILPPAVWRAIQLEWSILPLRSDKRPAIRSWKEYQSRRPHPEELAAWANQKPPAWGVITGAISKIVVLDFDGPEGAATMHRLGCLPHVLTPSGGYHVYCQYPGFKVGTLNAKAAQRLKAAFGGMDIRGDGGYAGFYGTVTGHDGTPGTYNWLRPSAPPDGLPAEVLAWLKQETAPDPAPQNRRPAAPLPEARTEVEPEWLIRQALERARSEGRNNAGFWLAIQCRDNGFSETEARALLSRYQSQTGPFDQHGRRAPYTEAEAHASVRAAYQTPARAPIERRRARKSSPPDPSTGQPHAVPPTPPPTPPAEPPSPPAAAAGGPLRRTDQGNAERLVRRHGKDIRYVPKWDRWIIWDGRRWRKDEDGEIYRRAVDTVRAIFDEAKKTDDDEDRRELVKHAFKSESRGALSAMIDLARHLRGIPVQPEELDSNPWLLNCQNGTLDLRTGELKPHRREDLITKIIPCAYNPRATCPRWLEFLELIQNGDAEKIAYLQRCVGYSLTGDVSERVLFLAWGSGQNGKSTFLETIALLAGEYGLKTPSETLMQRRENAPTNDIARLQGARYVYASETTEAGRLDVTTVKNLTGEAVLTARFLYGEIFEFRRLFKLWLGTNHKPIIRNAEDQAVWDRLRLIEFTIRIPDERKVRKSEVERWFRSELSGILNWALEGCRAYLREGLADPAAVTQATTSYRADMDIIGQFLNECTIAGESFFVRASDLYKAYRQWSEERGEKFSLSQTAFGLRMADRGYQKSHTRSGKVYNGIGLLDVTGVNGFQVTSQAEFSRETKLPENRSQLFTPVTDLKNQQFADSDEEF